MGDRKRSTAAEWASRIEVWNRSGLDADAFAARDGHAYTARTLRWWKSELKRRARSERPKPADRTAVTLMRMQVRGKPAAASRDESTHLEVAVGARVVVRVPASADVRRVAELVAALDGVKS